MSSQSLGPKLLKERHFYQFGPFRLEPEDRILLRDGIQVELEGGGKAFDLLVLLVANNRRLVRRDQIVRQVWPDSHVEENVINVQISHLRKLLGDGYISTRPRQGYQFDADVAEGTVSPEDVSHRRGRSFWVISVLVLVVITLVYALVRSRWKRSDALDPATALYQRALEYERSGDDEEARAILDQAIAADPKYTDACVRAAYLSYELEEMGNVGKYLDGCQKELQSSNENLRLKANALREVFRDNRAGAIELYQLLIDRYPRDTDALFRFAEVATDTDRLQDGEKAVLACLAIETDNVYCRFQSMLLKIKENRFGEVIADYKSLPKNIRNYPWFDQPLGLAFWGDGQFEEARRTFERLTQQQQRLHGTALFTAGREWLADMMLYQGRVDDATRRLQQIMETSDNASARGSYLQYLGEVHALVGDNVRAKEFAEAVGNSPSEPSSLTGAALVLASIGDAAGGEKLLKMRNKMTHEELSPADDHFFRGLLALAQRDVTTALEEIRFAYDLHPQDEEAAYWLGMAYFQADNYDSALTTFRALNDLKGTILLDDAPLLLPLTARRIAQCYEKLGNTKAAEPYNIEVSNIWQHADDNVRQLLLK
jgi:DNA-binding winged helix-turn-helix (wHTH) protein/tetratricopeptide (TPR) repeat protein